MKDLDLREFASENSRKYDLIIRDNFAAEDNLKGRPRVKSILGLLLDGKECNLSFGI